MEPQHHRFSNWTWTPKITLDNSWHYPTQCKFSCSKIHFVGISIVVVHVCVSVALILFIAHCVWISTVFGLIGGCSGRFQNFVLLHYACTRTCCFGYRLKVQRVRERMGFPKLLLTKKHVVFWSLNTQWITKCNVLSHCDDWSICCKTWNLETRKMSLDRGGAGWFVRHEKFETWVTEWSTWNPNKDHWCHFVLKHQWLIWCIKYSNKCKKKRRGTFLLTCPSDFIVSANVL